MGIEIIMKAVIQRVSEASVSIDGKVHHAIGAGFLVLLGIERGDALTDMQWMAEKIVQMRIFSDEQGKMNVDIKQINGDILLISQFTLMASTKKGNRPSFLDAAPPDKAIPMYQQTIAYFEKLMGKSIGTGIFGADMKVQLVNDGPVTILLDTKNKV